MSLYMALSGAKGSKFCSIWELYFEILDILETYSHIHDESKIVFVERKQKKQKKQSNTS